MDGRTDRHGDETGGADENVDEEGDASPHQLLRCVVCDAVIIGLLPLPYAASACMHAISNGIH